MSFSIDYDKQPIKFFRQQDKHIIQRVMDKIDEVLPENPVPHNSKSIIGKHNCFRIRIGDFRVLCRVEYETNKIIIFKVDKRPRAYD
jgi:mRNA-degrading endonuclease RelE of RelBE toxin-antitoxin system